MCRITCLVVLLLGSYSLLLHSIPVAPPLPGIPQTEWSMDEIGVIIHYNLATSAGTQGCNGNAPPPQASLFNPTAFNASQWVEVIQSLGAKYVVYVAKHGCGFTTWPTKTKLPDGRSYAYAVGQAGTSQRDIVGELTQAVTAAKLRMGFYYSVVSNAYLNVQNGQVQPNPKPPQEPVTQSQYESIVLAQLEELWSQYGPLLEVWFDGGYQQSIRQNISDLLAKHQPGAVAFNGYGASAYPLRWIGTEAGQAPNDTWSTGTANAGDPGSPVWCPAESDTTLQNFDQWFYSPAAGLRTLAELQTVYHRTVGHNTNLLLDIAPKPDGSIPADAQQRYQELGDWVRQCYGPTAAINSTSASGKTTVDLVLPKGAEVDRVVIQEDQSQGQLIRQWQLEGQKVNGGGGGGGGGWDSLATGQSIGNKRIVLLDRPTSAYAVLRLRATQTLAGLGPFVSRFAAHRC